MQAAPPVPYCTERVAACSTYRIPPMCRGCRKPTPRPHPSVSAPEHSAWDGAGSRAHTPHTGPAGSEERGCGPREHRHRCPPPSRGGAVGTGDGQGSIAFGRRWDLPELWGKRGREKREMRSALRNPGVNPLLSERWDVITPQVIAREADGGHLTHVYASHQLPFPPHVSHRKNQVITVPSAQQESKATSHTQKKRPRGFQSPEKQ